MSINYRRCRYPGSGSHPSKRRRIKRLRITAGLLAAVCPVIALVLLNLAFFHPRQSPEQYWLAGALLLASGLFLLLRAGLDAWYRRIRDHHKSANSKAHVHAEGSILFAALLICGLVAALAIQAVTAARYALRLNDARRERTLLRTAAADTVRVALQRLANDQDTDMDTLDEDWAQPIDLTTPSGIAVRVLMSDAQSRFDLNNASVTNLTEARDFQDVLTDIMIACGQFTPQARIDALRDWTDADTEGLYEGEAYQEQNRQPPDAVLASSAEVLQLAHWSADDFIQPDATVRNRGFAGELNDAVSVLPAQRSVPVAVNINTAPPLVLRGILGWEEEDALQVILQARERSPLRTLALMQTLRPGLHSRVAPWLDVRSNWFEIRARACRNAQCASIYVLASRSSEGKVEIVRWIY